MADQLQSVAALMALLDCDHWANARIADALVGLFGRDNRPESFQVGSTTPAPRARTCSTIPARMA